MLIRLTLPQRITHFTLSLTKKIPKCKCDLLSPDENMVARIASTTRTENFNVGLLVVDSGSFRSVLNESLAEEINNLSLVWWLTTTFLQMNQLLWPEWCKSKFQVTVVAWRTVVVRNCIRPLSGLDLFDALGISVTQTLYPIEGKSLHCTMCFQILKKTFPICFPELDVQNYISSNQSFTKYLKLNAKKGNLSIYKSQQWK